VTLPAVGAFSGLYVGHWRWRPPDGRDPRQAAVVAKRSDDVTILAPTAAHTCWASVRACVEIDENAAVKTCLDDLLTQRTETETRLRVQLLMERPKPRVEAILACRNRAMGSF